MLNPATSLPPGFRFHPTDEELILHYLRNRAASLPCPVSIIAEVDIYKFDPWELPAQSLFGEREWYFFSPRDRKYPNGARPNRAAASGYWKATGTDKSIVATGGTSRENIGVKKALVFYKGRPPKGVKTDWIMHEYRLGQAHRSNLYRPMNLKDSSMRLDDWVLCRIYRKSSHHAPGDAEQDSSADDGAPVATPSSNARAAPGGDAFLKLPNSCSLTELVETVDCSPLARLFDNPPDMTGVLEIFPAPASYPSMNQPFCSINGENSYSAPQPTTQTEPPVLIADIGALKRHRPAESGDPSRPSKRPTDSSTPTNNYFANKIDGRGAQLDLTSHPLFNHLLVMNAHLGSQ